MFDLGGRTALVTGSGRGVGRRVALALAARGAVVVTNDLDEASCHEAAEEIRTAGGAAHPAPFDVADADAVAAGVAHAREQAGPIDILVNNAGGVPGGMWPTRFLETDRETWPAFIGMNLYGTMHCSHAVLPDMIERGHGRIVSVSSDAARVGNIGSSIYGAAKAGVEGFTRTLAKEVGPKGVTVNAVVLGLIDTVPQEYLDQAKADRMYPMRRVGNPTDVAAGVVYLASDEAGWVTGHSLVINGGGTG